MKWYHLIAEDSGHVGVAWGVALVQVASGLELQAPAIQCRLLEAWGNHRHEQSICVHEQSIRVQEKSLMARQCKQTNCDVWCIVLFWFRKNSFDSKNKEELIEWEALESNSQKSRESCIPLSCAHPISDGTRKLSTLCCPPPMNHPRQ